MTRRWPVLRLAAAVLAVAAIASRTSAGDPVAEAKKAGKSIGKAATKLGREVADTAEKSAKTVWFKTRTWSTREAKAVADATVSFWDDVIDGKEAKRDKLRRENASLRKSKTGAPKRDR